MANSELNGFKGIEAEEAEKFPNAPKEVEEQLMGTVRTTKAVGNIIELYLSKMVEMLTALIGGSNSNIQKSRRRENSGQDSDFSPEGNSKKL